MAINLMELEIEPMNSGLAGKTIMLAGSNNLGKTLQATKLPLPLLISFEPGGSAINCPKISPESWAKTKEIFNDLCSKKLEDGMPKYEYYQKNMYRTIIIDTVEVMSDLCQKAVAADEGVNDISEITGKKNGYTIYRGAIKTEINRLVNFGYTVVFITHEEEVEKEDEKGNTYKFSQPKGWSNTKSEGRFICDLCDFVIHLESNGVDENGDTVLSTGYTKQTKRFFARSRFWCTPFKIEPFTAKNLEATIKKAVEDTAEMEEAEIEERFTVKENKKSVVEWMEDIKPIVVALIKYDKNKATAAWESILGEGNKISECDDVIKLEQVFNKLDTLAKNLNIEV